MVLRNDMLDLILVSSSNTMTLIEGLVALVGRPVNIVEDEKLSDKKKSRDI